MRMRALSVLGMLMIVGLIGVVACSTGTGPSASPAPSQSTAASTAASAKPAQSTAPAAKPATSPSASPSQAADWKAEWDKVLAAAKQEGKVVVAGGAGSGYRKAVDEFQKAYPDIKLEYTGGSGGTVHAPKILAERQGGLYLWDVFQGAGTVMLDPLIPNKVFAPLRPALILPEVVDNSKWLDGFDSGWIDLGQQFGYSPMPYLSYSVQVNRKLAPESELKTFDDLLNPKWKGKIAWEDPRAAGSGRSNARYFYYVAGVDWLRKVLSQDLVLTQDPRALLENLIRGSYPIAVGTRQDDVDAFTKEGLAGDLAYLDPDSKLGGSLTGGSSSIALIDRAPHPNAAKVFINWYLTKAAAEVYVKEAGLASMRLDVESPHELKPRPGDINTHSEKFISKVVPAADNLFKEVLR